MHLTFITTNNHIEEAFEYSPIGLKPIGRSKALGITVYSNKRIINKYLDTIEKDYSKIYKTVSKGVETGNILIGYKGRGILKFIKEVYRSSFKSPQSIAFYDQLGNNIIILVDQNVNILGSGFRLNHSVTNIVHELIHYVALNKPTSFFAAFSQELILFYKEFFKREFEGVELNDRTIKRYVKKLLDMKMTDSGFPEYNKLWVSFLKDIGLSRSDAEEKANSYLKLFKKFFITKRHVVETDEEQSIMKNIDDVYKDVFNMPRNTSYHILYSQEFVDPDEIIAVTNADSLKSKTVRLINSIRFKNDIVKSKAI